MFYTNIIMALVFKSAVKLKKFEINDKSRTKNRLTLVHEASAIIKVAVLCPYKAQLIFGRPLQNFLFW